MRILEKRRGKSDFPGFTVSKGFMTIEASVVVPVILFIALSIVMIFMHLYERDFMRGESYEMVYSVPYYSAKSDTGIVSYLKSVVRDNVYFFGETEDSAESINGNIICRGRVNYVVEDVYDVRHEIGKCTDRLRRWQLYDGFTEE